MSRTRLPRGFSNSHRITALAPRAISGLKRVVELEFVYFGAFSHTLLNSVCADSEKITKEK
jgi:hypothetical protein